MELFAEEVVRGGPAFAVSLVLSAMEPGFRAAAELGAWQLISPVNATGRVVVVSNLHEVQDKVHTGSLPLLAVCFCAPVLYAQQVHEISGVQAQAELGVVTGVIILVFARWVLAHFEQPGSAQPRLCCHSQQEPC